MYNVIRRIHLYCGLIIVLFLMMYFVTGYLIIHRPWFGGPQNAVAKTLVQLHRAHGYGGGAVRNAYIAFNDLASFSCILFAVTGVYLWWKTARRKALGLACLFASISYGLGMILYLMYSR